MGITGHHISLILPSILLYKTSDRHNFLVSKLFNLLVKNLYRKFFIRKTHFISRLFNGSIDLGSSTHYFNKKI